MPNNNYFCQCLSLAWQPYFTAVQWSHKCPQLTCTPADCSSVISLLFSARVARKMARMAHPERLPHQKRAFTHRRQPAHEWLNSGCARLCVVKERAKSECKRRCRIGRREKKKVRPARERGRLWNNSGWNRRVRFAIWEHWRVASGERERERERERESIRQIRCALSVQRAEERGAELCFPPSPRPTEEGWNARVQGHPPTSGR